MKYDELNNFIYNYLEFDHTNRALLLKGDWGTGKSYYIENTLKPFLEFAENRYKCTIVSLFGINDLLDNNPLKNKDAKELPEVLLLIDAVSQCFTDGTVVGNLIIFGFCPLEINVNPLLKMLLTLFLSVGWGKVIEAVIDMQHFGYHVVGFLGYRSLSSFLANGFDEICNGFLYLLIFTVIILGKRGPVRHGDGSFVLFSRSGHWMVFKAKPVV